MLLRPEAFGGVLLTTWWGFGVGRKRHRGAIWSDIGKMRRGWDKVLLKLCLFLFVDSTCCALCTAWVLYRSISAFVLPQNQSLAWIERFSYCSFGIWGQSEVGQSQRVWCCKRCMVSSKLFGRPIQNWRLNSSKSQTWWRSKNLMLRVICKPHKMEDERNISVEHGNNAVIKKNPNWRLFETSILVSSVWYWRPFLNNSFDWEVQTFVTTRGSIPWLVWFSEGGMVGATFGVILAPETPSQNAQLVSDSFPFHPNCFCWKLGTVGFADSPGHLPVKSETTKM